MLSNANSKKELRNKQALIAQKYNAKFILVYFDYSNEYLLKRIENTQRSTNILVSSKNFKEVLDKQNLIFETPAFDETEHIIFVKEGTSLDELSATINEKVSQEVLLQLS